MQTDEACMASYIAGDRAAFAELFRRYSPALRAMLQRRLKSPPLVEDLVQQTFLQMHRARNDFRDGARVRPWLFTIAMNLARGHARRLQRSPFRDTEAEGSREPNQFRDQVGRELHELLVELPKDQREVIVLYWFEGLSFAEIADRVGASLSAVKVRAHRGYKGLRASLQQDGNRF